MRLSVIAILAWRSSEGDGQAQIDWNDLSPCRKRRPSRSGGRATESHNRQRRMTSVWNSSHMIHRGAALDLHVVVKRMITVTETGGEGVLGRLGVRRL